MSASVFTHMLLTLVLPLKVAYTIVCIIVSCSIQLKLYIHDHKAMCMDTL